MGNKFRPGIIYAYSAIDPDSGRRIRWAYVGKTRQKLVNRHNQHMVVQPWSDLFPNVRIVFSFNSCPDWWLSLVEKLTIKFTRPLYNYDYNTKNRRRIPKYAALKQRKERDLLRRKQRARMKK